MKSALLLSFLIPSLAAAAPQASVREFLNGYCAKCHCPEKQKGDLRVDDLTGDVKREGARWAALFDWVKRGEMPPEEAKQPSAEHKHEFLTWIKGQLGAHAQVKPNLGNLVPHDLLFGAAAGEKNGTQGERGSTAPRLWRLSPSGYLGWVETVARRVPPEIVQPFSENPERGIKDFANLSRVDEPTTEVLLRNAEVIVDRQTAMEMVDGKMKAKFDTVREFTDLMTPGIAADRRQLTKALEKQFSLAVARKPEPEEAERLLALYDKCLKQGDPIGARLFT